MSFLAPLWLAAAVAVGVGLVIAHLFSTSVPPRDYLPTVRFVPEGAPLAVMRTRRVSDIALLLLRLLAVALFGLALAGAYVKRSGTQRVVLVDVSRAVRSAAEVRDSARAVSTDGAVLIAFDSVARRVSGDSLAAMTATAARGSLSAALVAAHRAIASATDGRERTELVVISPVVREEVDSATARLLALWAGPVRQIPVAIADAPAVAGIAVRANGDDPVAAAVQIPHVVRDDNRTVIPSAARNLHVGVRIVRTTATRADSAWARDSGGVLVAWPAEMHTSALARRAATDTATGIADGKNVVVASFARTHQPRPGRAVVRWVDGEAAATETTLGRGCVREVAIAVDAVGDVVLRDSFRGIVATLTEPCGGARDFGASVILSEAKDLLSADKKQILRSAQDDNLRAAQDDTRAPMAIWLAAFALALLIAEQLLRARPRTAT